jgi:alkylation response protein AidB-like acyl-CoA dehydrogenase
MEQGSAATDDRLRCGDGAAPTSAVILERAVALRPLLTERAAEGERLRRLPADVVDALTEADLMRLCLPADYGGPEVDPVTLIDAIAAVAEGDGAAGWCAMIASTTSSLAAFLPVESARHIYGDPAVVTGGVFAPNGTGTSDVVDGVAGFRVTGRWPWGSGTQHCQWVLGGTRCDDDIFRLCWMPAAEVEFHDTWHSSGMRGSGSLDYSVNGVFVPAVHTTRPGVTRPVVDSPLARFPNFSLLAAAVAAVGLGVARHALDELYAVAEAKRPQFASRTLAESSYTQVEIARAEAAWRAARAFLRDELAAAWDDVCSGRKASLERRAGIRLAAVQAASSAVSVADTAYTVAGGTSVYETSPLGRLARDAHVVTQHIQTAPKLNETIGKVLLGIDTDVSLF